MAEHFSCRLLVLYINIVIPQQVWSLHYVVNSTCVVYVLHSELYCSFACLFFYATVLVSAFFAHWCNKP